MRVPGSIPIPELFLVTRRPTGLELYQVHIPPLNPLALIVLPGDRAHLGGWALAETARQLELTSAPLISVLVRSVLNGVLPICRRSRVRELALRVETGPDVAPLAWSEVMPGFQVRHRYRRLSSPVLALQARLEVAPPSERALSVASLPGGRPVTGELWNAVPDFPSWFVRLFESIFTPDTDREIAEAPRFQLALLELILAAGWQTPTMSVLSWDEEALGIVLSRPLLPVRGELSFVGLAPRVQGQPGFGRALMSAGVAALVRAQVEVVQCSVAEDNPRSYAFFAKKWGFVPAGTEEVLVQYL